MLGRINKPFKLTPESLSKFYEQATEPLTNLTLRKQLMIKPIKKLTKKEATYKLNKMETVDPSSDEFSELFEELKLFFIPTVPKNTEVNRTSLDFVRHLTIALPKGKKKEGSYLNEVTPLNYAIAKDNRLYGSNAHAVKSINTDLKDGYYSIETGEKIEPEFDRELALDAIVLTAVIPDEAEPIEFELSPTHVDLSYNILLLKINNGYYDYGLIIKAIEGMKPEAVVALMRSTIKSGSSNLYLKENSADDVEKTATVLAYHIRNNQVNSIKGGRE